MKPVRKPRQSKKETYDEAAEPQHPRSELDADGNVIFVTNKKGYPAAGEPISDDIAAFALRHRRVDIVARYLRETPTLSKHFRSILADMLEAPPDSIEEYRLEFVRQSCGSPKGSTLAAQARAQARQNHIGRYALASGRHGTKKAQQEFGYPSSYVEKAKRLVKSKKDK
jgi:hypothetical protein